MIELVVASAALALFAQSMFSLYLMLYSWEHPDRLKASSGPETYDDPKHSFTILLPARHEESVIYHTVKRAWETNYPEHLKEVIVVCHADDRGTIAEAQRAANEIGSSAVRVETFTSEPINKPRGLNVGLHRSSNDVVTIFDAEDDMDPDILNVVNTVMNREGAGIVQAGVQLMNYRDHWFSAHNCLEYFYWFKSRLHFHARIGMIPLGGNTVFFRRDLLEQLGGWDDACLTEDADVGVRLSTLGETIRVVYDAQHVTREETPDSVGSFIKQRTRWLQGFLQVLRKGDWLHLPRFRQRLLALYTFSYPLFQGLLVLLLPVMIFTILQLKVHMLVAVISFLPLYALLLQLVVTVVGLLIFAREYGYGFPVLAIPKLVITFLPFQWMLGISSVRAIYRELRRQTNWEKTAHSGAHRQPAAGTPVDLDALLQEARARVGAERASLMLWDDASDSMSVIATSGLSAESIEHARQSPEDGVAGWVARTGEPMVVNGKPLPSGVSERLNQPDLRSALIIPIDFAGSIIAVLNVSSTWLLLDDNDVLWLTELSDELPERITDAVLATGARPMPETSMPVERSAALTVAGENATSGLRQYARRNIAGILLALVLPVAIALSSGPAGIPPDGSTEAGQVRQASGASTTEVHIMIEEG